MSSRAGLRGFFFRYTACLLPNIVQFVIHPFYSIRLIFRKFNVLLHPQKLIFKLKISCQDTVNGQP